MKRIPYSAEISIFKADHPEFVEGDRVGCLSIAFLRCSNSATKPPMIGGIEPSLEEIFAHFKDCEWCKRHYNQIREYSESFYKE